MLPFFLFFFFPYRNLNRPTRTPVVTLLLIAINFLAFAGELRAESAGQWDVIQNLMYEPGQSHWITLATCTFLHSGPLHLAFNMWFLHLVGGQVEERMGRGWFLLFYLGAGVIASLGHGLFCFVVRDALAGESIRVLGASGAVYGVLGAYFILYPFEEFRFWFFVLFRWGTLEVATLFFVVFKVFGDTVYAYSQFLDIESSSVAHWAHLAGLVFGIAIALIAFGAEPFTGKPRLSQNEKACLKRLRRKARRKFYGDGLLPEPLSEEELEIATDDISPEEGIRRGLFFHSGRVLEWACQEMLFENPKACVEPRVQLELIEALNAHGRDGLAQVACWNLIETHPDAPESLQARFVLGRALAKLPEMRSEAARLLREFLECEPAMRERVEAERLLKRLDDRPLWRWKG